MAYQNAIWFIFPWMIARFVFLQYVVIHGYLFKFVCHGFVNNFETNGVMHGWQMAYDCINHSFCDIFFTPQITHYEKKIYPKL